MPPRLTLVALALLILAPVAFWPGYVSRIGAADGHTHAHAALGTAWLVLLAVQPMLARTSRVGWHRRLGRWGVLVGVGFVVSSLLVAHRSLARMNAEQFANEGRFVYLPLAMAVLFAVALGMGVRWRRTPSIHGRYMAATMLPLLDPLFARLLSQYAAPLPMPWLHQLPAFVVMAGALVMLRGTLPPASPGRTSFSTFCVGALLLLMGFFVVPQTHAWASICAAFRALPLT